MPRRRTELTQERPQVLSRGEETFLLHCRAYGLNPEREVCLIPGRKWRWDFVLGDVAIEIQGNTWGKGAHSTGKGIRRDCEKVNAATCAGYRVLLFTTEMVESGEAIDLLRTLLGGNVQRG